ncbi:MAG: HNH endonuclease [Acidobacteria bacterium]|nr:HNH endonuclease [Acidobacteriota bacterium]
MFSGCTRAVQWTEAHHVRPCAEGGKMSVENCWLLCSYRHHNPPTENGRVTGSAQGCNGEIGPRIQAQGLCSLVGARGR